MRVRWTTNAAADLTRIVERIREDNPSAALRIARIIYKGVAALRTFPNRGRIGLAKDRVWRRYNFTMTLPALIWAASLRNPASSASVGAPMVNWRRKCSANDFFKRSAVRLSKSPSRSMILYAAASS